MTEPVSLDLAKLQCRVLDNSEDDLIDSYITAARCYVENATGSILIQRQIVEQRDEFGCFVELHYRPVVSIDEVGYLDTDGAAQTYADFFCPVGRDPTRIYPALSGEWPTISSRGDVTITYTAGYVDGEAPPALIQAMLLLVGHWYANRESVAVGDVSNEVQLAVRSLCGPYWRPVI